MPRSRTLRTSLRLLVCSSLLLQVANVSIQAGEPQERTAFARLDEIDWTGWRDLDGLLEDVRETVGVPALAAAFVRDGEIVVSATAGVSAFGSEERVDSDARFHVGSVTKSVTAALVGKLVEDGVLEWDTAIGEVLPEVAMQESYRDVTIEELLQHRGGLAPYTDSWPADHPSPDSYRGTAQEKRAAFVGDALKREPVGTPRETTTYSNAGYAVAGHLAERASGLGWEQLVARHVFEPLGMASAGFGFPESPLGHAGNGPRFQPVPVDAYPPMEIIAPAGNVHGSIGDLARYARAHLAGLGGRDGFLLAATVKRLHGAADKPGALSYASGWRVTRSPDGDPVHAHGGSVGASYAEVRLYPARDCAVVFLTTVGPGLGEALAHELTRTLLERLGPPAPSSVTRERGRPSPGVTVVRGEESQGRDARLWRVVRALSNAINEEDRDAYHGLFAASYDRDQGDIMFDFMARNVLPARGGVSAFHEPSEPLRVPGSALVLRLVTFHLENGYPGYYGITLDDEGKIEEFSLFVKGDLCPNGVVRDCALNVEHMAREVAGDAGARVEEALQRAVEARTRPELWNALTTVAELCSEAPSVEARSVRERALAILASNHSDTQRWSSLVARSFLPPFSRLPRASWEGELDAYDGVLDALVAGATVDRVRAELLHAKAFARVYVDRRWDFLGPTGRREALGLLEDIEGRFGSLPVPGAAGDDPRTVGERARAHAYELSTLRFGAPAPKTAGIDLEGEPLDLAQYRGSVVVLDFWTTFCQPCLALVPGVRGLLEELEGEPLAYLGVCGDVDRAEGLATARRVGMTWRNLWDGPRGTEGPAAETWNVPALGWPSVFVIDAQGRIRHKLRGKEQIEAELSDVVRALLEERAGLER